MNADGHRYIKSMGRRFMHIMPVNALQVDSLAFIGVHPIHPSFNGIL